LLAVAAAGYDVARFSITTDTDNLIAKHLPWRQRQADLAKAFPQKEVLVVVTAPTPEDAERATNALEKDGRFTFDFCRTLAAGAVCDLASIARALFPRAFREEINETAL
jgi:hypothetical protein